MASFNVLVIGDVVGRPGRKALKELLPELKVKYKPDLTVINGENLAHGYGVTDAILKDLQESGVDFFTSGNHIFQNQRDLNQIFKNNPVIRPANYPDDKPGKGYKIFDVGMVKVMIVNLQGQVFFPLDEQVDNPFLTLDKILKEEKAEKPKIIIVDFHAEATSEKKGFGAYADGRVSLVFGTHTHVQTSDNYIMPKGTGYISDIGMTGIKHSSLGMDFENVISNFVHETTLPKQISTNGNCIVNGIFAKIDVESGQALDIQRIAEEVEV
ncbi:metallophosphoesterase [Candidatus Falkowbacteria bacterium RIFOXYD2_FULL_35_9]|uniref:Metallophosphoesterase n=1 Tax=Candidatus Falkowbacteria bacterium RIFOXYC2_FULL_36_12 TaxID=1798002 RepID=A0A1F5T368_9BACT|nr:MAG: metallophosphoesterase [Candidatus Falkowbacteria bacterium RIFOXYB2_FULL_35_7]OGF33076.1 MAG: metallophosphoesterase [Candidatus Falkowbacteria bacterium RIFOXYA2_FULL_35_8]OGF33362.1 MAG: metallophosphoesterase [Candidatus Falkowbacteria bacterium RIFOXYC2_FULL_36_12]OGF45607.1 MAG: metallophosphoesterase [Candidatus Falkowbacteria bacterium RIFOXYD2_FULL_35_9]